MNNLYIEATGKPIVAPLTKAQKKQLQREGYQDHLLGKLVTGHPYPIFSAEWDAWLIGWWKRDYEVCPSPPYIESTEIDVGPSTAARWSDTDVAELAAAARELMTESSTLLDQFTELDYPYLHTAIANLRIALAAFGK